MSDLNHVWVLYLWETEDGRLVEEPDVPQVCLDREALETQVFAIIKRDAQHISIAGSDEDPVVRRNLRARAEMREYVKQKNLDKAMSAWIGYQVMQRKQKHLRFEKVPVLGVVDVGVH
jgi:hypothetical protein